jgi:hypothetical protein
VTRQSEGQRVLSVSRVLWGATAQRESIDESTDVTIAQYFSQHFNFVARPDEPVVRSSSGQLFPASFLAQVGLTQADRLDGKIAAAVEAASQPDSQTAAKLEELLAALRADKRSSELLASFGLAAGGRLELLGRPLPRPEIIGGARVAVPPLLKKAPLVIAQDPHDALCSQKFVPALITAAMELGVVLPPPSVIAAKAVRPGQLVEVIVVELASAIRAAGCPSFVIIVAEEGPVDAVVPILIGEWCIPCTILTAAELFGQREVPPELTRRIVSEVTVKCGGVTHFAFVPLRATVALGIAAHEGIVGIVASIDRTFARFASGIGTLDDLAVTPVLATAISQFQRLSGIEPTRIVVYWLRRGGLEAQAVLRSVKTKLDIAVVEVEEAAGIAAPGDGAVAVDPPGSGDRTEFLLVAGRRAAKYTVVGERPHRVMSRDDLTLATFWLSFAWPNCEGMAQFPAPLMAAIANCEYAVKHLRGRQAPEPLRNGFMFFTS